MTHQHLYRNHRTPDHVKRTVFTLVALAAGYMLVVWTVCQIYNWMLGL